MVDENKNGNEITKKEFMSYEEVRVMGRTNMFHLINVMALSGLSREKIIKIQENYRELSDKYLKNAII